ncbi:unnamed protein product, partial [Allacma fusca]
FPSCCECERCSVFVLAYLQSQVQGICCSYNNMDLTDVKTMCESLGIPAVDSDAPLSASLFLAVMSRININNNNTLMKVEELETRVNILEGFKGSYDEYTDSVDFRMEKMQKRLDILETDIRKKSIVIGGLSCGGRSCSETVNKFFMETFKLQLPFEKAFPLQPAGKRKHQSHPPLIKVTFRDPESKSMLYKCTHKLRDSDIYIRDDFTPEEREKRKLLSMEMKKAKDAGKDAKLKGTTLIISGTRYIIQNGKIRPIRSKAPTPSKMDTGE